MHRIGMILIGIAFTLVSHEARSLGLGLQASFLFSCLSTGGLQLQVPMNNFFVYETDLLFTNYSSVYPTSTKSQYDPARNSDIRVIEGSFHRRMFYHQLRFFLFGGRFNLAIGAGIASTDVKMEIATSDGSQTYKEHATVRSVLDGFSLGHMWRKKDSYFGIDWIGGAYVRKYWMTSDSSSPTDPTLSAGREQFYLEDGKCIIKGGGTLLSMVFGTYL